MQLFCTACGAIQFRSAVFKTAYETLGDCRPLPWRNLRSAWVSLNSFEREPINQEIISELRKIRSLNEIPLSGLTVLLYNIDDIRWTHGQLDEALKGCAVGERLASMRCYYAEQKKKEALNRRNREKRKRAHELAHLHKTLPVLQNERTATPRSIPGRLKPSSHARLACSLR